MLVVSLHERSHPLTRERREERLLTCHVSERSMALLVIS